MWWIVYELWLLSESTVDRPTGRSYKLEVKFTRVSVEKSINWHDASKRREVGREGATVEY